MIRINEAFSPDLPKFITSNREIVRGLNKRGIDLANAKYVGDEPPRSGRDKKISDPNRIPVYLITDKSNQNYVYIPGINDPYINSGNWNWAYVSKLSGKKLLELTYEYGYIDCTNDDNFKTSKQSARRDAQAGMVKRGRGQYPTKYDVEYGLDDDGHRDFNNIVSYKTRWVTRDKEDKSGYIPDPGKYVRMLYQADKDNYAEKLQRLYDSIMSTKTMVGNALVAYDIDPNSEEYDRNFDNLGYAQSELNRAITGYKSIIRDIARLEDRKYFDNYFIDDGFGFADNAKSVYGFLKQTKEYLKKAQG